MRVRFQAESDEWCRAVLAARFPGVPCYPDVRAVGADDLPVADAGVGADVDTRSARRGAGAHDAAVERLDVLCGGFPCQDVSVAGNRAGLAGERSGLFHEFARIADALRPRWLLVENVPGLLSSNGGRDFGLVLGTLADLGYGCAWRVLDSRFFGVPQRRRRVFVVGHLGDDGGRALRALCEGCDGSPATGACSWQGAPSGAGGRVARSLNGHHPRFDGDTEDFVVVNALTRLRGGPDDNKAQAGHLVATAFHLTQDPISGEIAPAMSKGNADGCATIAVAFSENQRGELRETDYARQMSTGGGKPGQGYPAVRQGAGVRRLTPVECERLQSFPDGWTDVPGLKCPDSKRYAAMGNAVTVNVAEWIGRRIMAVDAS